MKKYYANDEIIKGYVNDPRSTDGGEHNNIFFEKGILYSYGYHFPLAVLVSREKGGFSEDFFLINGDETSTTTAKHRGILFSMLNQERYAVVPFSALLQAAYDGNISTPNRLAIEAKEKIRVIHHKKDYWITKEVLRPNRDTGEKENVEVREHFLGCTLLDINGDLFLSAIDSTGKGRGHYFLTKLPEKVKTTEDAYESIKPPQVKDKEYERQGEWFFVPQGDFKVSKENVVSKKFPLPNRGMNPRDWRHIANEGVSIDGNVYVRGTVRHPEHKMLSFGKVWHIAYESPGAGEGGAIISYSASGGFD